MGMSKTQEQRSLKQLKKNVCSQNKSIFLSWWINPVLWVLVAVTFVGLQRFNNMGAIEVWVVIIVSAIAGAVVGAIIIVQVSEKQWPYIKPHISVESINERLSELDT
ncbi:MAG TPA: hypothetical protein PK018_06405 [Candidatus Competibacter sp.]|nr:hypothetical protein [Candidatus Competibacteraceae bacterium]HPE71787.1 hypothetical protein [Candidatus Competibacter sp.]